MPRLRFHSHAELQNTLGRFQILQQEAAKKTERRAWLPPGNPVNAKAGFYCINKLSSHMSPTQRLQMSKNKTTVSLDMPGQKPLEAMGQRRAAKMNAHWW